MKEIDPAAMPLSESTEAQLLAYAYGELSGPEARAFEQRLQGDAELRAELASIMATRELFGRDARFGIESQVDVPPPHLLDAILRSEALARPPAIRDARAVAARPSLTARLSRWMIGGGVLVGATAALLVVVSQSKDEAVLVSMPSAAAPAEQPMQERARAPDSAADGKAEAKEIAKEDRAPAFAEPTAMPATPMPDAPEPLVRTDSKPKPTEPPADAVSDKLRDLESDARGGLAFGAAAGPGGGGGRAAADPSAPLAKDAPASSMPKKPQPGPVAEEELAGEERSAAASRRSNTVSGGDSLAVDSVADDEGARPTASSVQAQAAPAPPPPPQAAPASTPVTLGMVSADEAKAERRRLADVRREQSDKSGKAKKSASKSESVESQAAQAPAKGAATGAKADDTKKVTESKKVAEKAPLREVGNEGKRAMQAEISLMSGFRELKNGRPLDALDEFQSAERLDARRQLGSDPHVGQMRALLALKRPAEALAIARRLVTRNVAEGGVVDGLLLGAKTAEDVGDLRTARELWSALSKVPAQKVAAAAALARLGNPAVRAATDADAAAEASEAPAAAAPAAKE